MKKIRFVYVSASSMEMERAARWMEMLGKTGIQCTSLQWVEDIKKVGVANPCGWESPEVRRGYADADEQSIRQSDLLWFLVPGPTLDNHGRGGYYEAGLAKALGKTLVFSGDTKQSIFCAHGTEFDEDIDAFAHVCKLAREDTYP